MSAALIADTNDRTRAIDAVWREAAASEPTIAAALQEREDGRRSDLADGLVRVLGYPVDDETLDTVWVITSPETWAKLHDERGWSLDTYRTWVATLLDTLLPRA